MAFLEIKNLVKTYNGLTVLNKINIQLNLNEFVFIIGESGSGKSTFLNCVGLIEKCDKGKIKINNKDVRNRSKFRNSYYGYVFQDSFLIDYLSIKENARLPCKNTDNNALDELIKNLNIDYFVSNNINVLSGGEQQKVSLLRCFYNNPKIIIADEPTSSLDKDNAIKIIELMKNNSEGKLFIISTHDIDIARKYGTKIIKIENGSINIEEINKTNQIEYAESISNLKRVSIDNSIHRFTRFLRKYKKFPIIISVLISLSLTLLMSVIGLYNGFKNYPLYELNKRADSYYYEFTKNKDESNINLQSIFEKNNIEYEELFNYNYIFNYLLKDDITYENDINFPYEISVIISDYKIMQNSLFASNYLKNSITIKTNTLFFGTQLNIDESVDMQTTTQEGKLLNTSKIYLSYDYVSEIFNKIIDKSIHNEISDFFPKYYLVKGNIDTINSVLKNSPFYGSYLDTNNDYVVTYKSSNLILTEGFNSLIKSIYYIVLLMIIIMILSSILLYTNLLEYLIRKRDTEYAIKIAFGDSPSSIKKEIFLQVFSIFIVGYFLSIIMFLGIHFISYMISSNILLIEYNYNIIDFDIKSLISALYVCIMNSVFITRSFDKTFKESKIMEVLKNG